VKESTALGAAIYAGVGAGLYEDAATTAASLARFERTAEPGEEAVAAYRDLYPRWIELYRRSLEMSEAGLVAPLWRAAGTREPNRPDARSAPARRRHRKGGL
jgi:autoinducer 2 (AI-2) kinase